MERIFCDKAAKLFFEKNYTVLHLHVKYRTQIVNYVGHLDHFGSWTNYHTEPDRSWPTERLSSGGFVNDGTRSDGDTLRWNLELGVLCEARFRRDFSERNGDSLSAKLRSRNGHSSRFMASGRNSRSTKLICINAAEWKKDPIVFQKPVIVLALVAA
ncbi:hypothetical protein WN51_12302 [Melipona quadrifasciata]|uniref:Uncharacterized protein n=1 Tax=Melipona quadrifasciata TaxID=166423 RepID=A0A0N0BL34_9HYME|nr:hypothetical protein WN51_12302 [Melipona quadrifasciata]